jgi:predicted GNAT family acetyltransferase
LRLADRGDQSPFLRATLDMFQEETSLALSAREIEAFRLSVKQKIREQRAWVIFDDADRLVFKAGIGLPTPTQAHLEGVYVAPELRGRGMGRMAMNLVCRSISSQFSLISLTVNRGNDAALALYEGMGFEPRCRYLTTYVYE